ncbi:MAG: Uma2 family endonuclease [Deltaproteobacteria bacterium]|nr:Uma2 family endonuclease [Deltaproteobacteria bacterium]
MARVARAVAHDPTVYPEEENMGEESLQRFICELLRPLIERYLIAKKIVAFVGADQFIYYRKHDPRGRVAPDVYVLDGVRPGRRIRTWKTWLDGAPPSFALEVVSGDVAKDYEKSPERYDECGVRELVVFDPDFEEERDRIRFQVFRRVGKRGLVRVLATNEDRVASKTLGCHVVAVGAGEGLRLRLGVGKDGDELFPTEAERERGEKERERGEKERERGEKERALLDVSRERAARLAAEEELERLRAKLKKG